MAESALDETKLTLSRGERIAEFKRRKAPYETIRVPREDLERYQNDGWELERELQRGVRVRRRKSHDEVLENQFWILLYWLGYERLNKTRNFKVEVQSEGRKYTKQIDVFACDNETFIVAECKSSSEMRKRSLQKDIGEMDSLKRPIANALRKAFGDSPKRKILWFMVTSRIRWTQEDLTRAESRKIIPVQDSELRYFLEIAKTLGRAAKYQFHAEFLAGQKIPALEDTYVQASRFKLGGRYAYSFSVEPDQLLKRAFVNHRDLRDPTGAPAYQRLITPGRLRKIAKFIESGGYFANSILVNFHNRLRFDAAERSADGDVQFGRLYLPPKYKSCWIIDGQHRLYGAAVAGETVKPPVMPIVAFEGLPPEDEANLFAVINKEQKPVQKKLLDELEGELKWGSSDPREAMNAIASRALDMLRNEALGPFEDRIALPGTKAQHQPLTVPQLKPEIVRSGLIGRVSKRDGTLIPGPLSGKTDEETLSNICGFLGAFFTKVRDANPTAWSTSGIPLCHNTAVPGLIRLAAACIEHVQVVEKVDVHELRPDAAADAAAAIAEPFLSYVREASPDEFRMKFAIRFGSGGIPQYFYKVAELIHDRNSKFYPEGLVDFIQANSVERTERADKLVKAVVDNLHRYVVDVLRAKHGAQFFEKAIKNQEMKVRCYKKRVETDPGGVTPLEDYLDILDLKKIVETKENWPLFENALSIRLPDQPKSGVKFVKWIEELNDIRKKFAHPYNRSYTDAEADLLELMATHLTTEGVIENESPS